MNAKNIYRGLRYVPKILGTWDNSRKTEYEALVVVLWQGASYTSKKPVPKGVDIFDANYWVCTGNYNAQVEIFRREIKDKQNKNDDRIIFDNKNIVDAINKNINDIKSHSGSLETIGTDIFNIKNDITSLEGLLDILDNHLKDLRVDIKDFGAKGDGFTDDTTAIINAFNYAKTNGGIVYFPPTKDSYIFSGTITPYKNMIVQGNGLNSKIKYTGSGDFFNIQRVGDSWLTWTTDFVIDKLYVEGNHGNTNFITINEGHKGLISRCNILWFKNGINLQYGYMLDFYKNDIIENDNAGIWFNPVTPGNINAINILSNMITRNDYGVLIGNGFSLGYSQRYAGNTCYCQYNTIQGNKTTQVDVSEYIGFYAENNYTEATYLQDNQYIFTIGRQGTTIPKNINTKNNTMSEHISWKCTPVKIYNLHGGVIDTNIFWDSKSTYDVELSDTGNIKYVYFGNGNIRYKGDDNIKSFNIYDTKNVLIRDTSYYPTVNSGWRKVGASNYIVRRGNTVRLQGEFYTVDINGVASALTSSKLFDLPVGLWPKEDKIFKCHADRKFTTNYASWNIGVKVATTGVVSVISDLSTDGTFGVGQIIYLYLDSISFDIEY